MSKLISIFACVVAATVMTGVVLREPSVDLFRPPQTIAASPQRQLAEPHSDSIRREASKRIKPTLDWADQESERQLEIHLKAITEYFKSAKKGTRPFADDALGYSSKWRLIADKIPFTDGDRHERYLRGRFEKHVFEATEMAKVIEQSLAGYLGSIQDVENRMLVKMRADVADLPPNSLTYFTDDATLKSAFGDVIRLAAKQSDVDLQSDAAREIASIVAGEVLAFVAVKIGVSAGILSAGAGSSWATLGVGFVVGVIVDQIVSWVWDWWADPTGDLAEKMNNQLDSIHTLMIEGDSKNLGLRSRMQEIMHERSRARRVAMSSLLQEN